MLLPAGGGEGVERYPGILQGAGEDS